MIVRSPWRTLLYKELAALELSGAVIDLGGSRKSAYLENFKGDFKLTVANLESDGTQDVSLNLENPFSLPDNSYDQVLCINVLEHIFNYQNVLAETQRILKTGGKAVFAVPFLIQVHPSPSDHWRFTGETLERLFKASGFSEVEVIPIGTGVFGSVAQLKFNVLHFALLRTVCIKLARVLDSLLAAFSKSKMYSKDYYPLGYLVKARK